jgi:hypothetical protein
MSDKNPQPITHRTDASANAPDHSDASLYRVSTARFHEMGTRLEREKVARTNQANELAALRRALAGRNRRLAARAIVVVWALATVTIIPGGYATWQSLLPSVLPLVAVLAATVAAVWFWPRVGSILLVVEALALLVANIVWVQSRPLNSGSILFLALLLSLPPLVASMLLRGSGARTTNA